MKQGFRRTAAAVMTVTLLTAVMSAPASAASNGLVTLGQYASLRAATITSASGSNLECAVNSYDSNNRGPYYMCNTRLRVQMTDYETVTNGKSFQNCPFKNQFYTVTGQNDNHFRTYTLMLENTARAYDFYKSLGFVYAGTNTSKYTTASLDETIYIAPMQRDENNPVPQLDATSANGIMVFGNGDDRVYPVGVAPDIVMHEFTHLVTQQLCGWDFSNMTSNKNVGRLAEAYSDIMAELSEDTPDWRIGTAAFSNNPAGIFCFRNLENPTGTTKPSNYENRTYYTHYSQLLSNPNIDDLYTPSTIISHAAYLMNKSGISAYDLQRIWYQSLGMYPVTADGIKNITFFTCRDNVIKAAESYYKSRGYRGTRLSNTMSKVIQAFNEVGLDHETNIDQERAESASNMAYFIAAKKSVLRPDEYWTGGDPNASVSYAGEYNDHMNYVPGGPVVFKDFSMSFWQDREPYYQCAGFAKKLQSDYFGTSVVTRLTANDISEYHPRIGDHLRVRFSYTGPEEDQEHSVFITAVSGNSFTYADANSDGYNVIKYDRSGSVSGSGSSLTIRLGSSGSSFVFVERPLKFGDLNADGELDSKDLTALNQLQNGTAPTFMVDTLYRNLASDPSGDGIMSSSDISYLRNLISQNYYIRFFGYVR